MPDNRTYDRSSSAADGLLTGDLDRAAMPLIETPAPQRTGPGAFRPGDHVHSIACRGRTYRRTFGVMSINPDGSLHLWAHSHGHIRRANPARWERLLRNEELR